MRRHLLRTVQHGIRREVLVESHPDIATSHFFMGVCMHELYKQKEALVELRAARDTSFEILGERQPDVDDARKWIGWTMYHVQT